MEVKKKDKKQCRVRCLYPPCFRFVFNLTVTPCVTPKVKQASVPAGDSGSKAMQDGGKHEQEIRVGTGKGREK